MNARLCVSERRRDLCSADRVLAELLDFLSVNGLIILEFYGSIEAVFRWFMRRR